MSGCAGTGGYSASQNNESSVIVNSSNIMASATDTKNESINEIYSKFVFILIPEQLWVSDNQDFMDDLYKSFNLLYSQQEVLAIFPSQLDHKAKLKPDVGYAKTALELLKQPIDKPKIMIYSSHEKFSLDLVVKKINKKQESIKTESISTSDLKYVYNRFNELNLKPYVLSLDNVSAECLSKVFSYPEQVHLNKIRPARSAAVQKPNCIATTDFKKLTL